MRKFYLFALLSSTLLFAPADRAEAQSFAIGGHFGYDVEFENTLVGGQARIGGGGFPLVFQPGVEVGLGDDVDYTWLEGNLLYMVGENYTIAFTPYVGAGVSVELFEDSRGTDTEFGLNVLAGVELNGLSRNIVPFAQIRYTAASGRDPAAIMGGILFRFGSY